MAMAVNLRESALSTAEAAAWIGTSVPDGTPAVVMIGAGRDEGLTALAARTSTTRVLLLEPDPEASERIVRNEEWSKWIAAGRLMVLAGPSYGRASEAAQAFRQLNRAPVLVYPPLVATHPDEAGAARRVVYQLQFEAQANEGARRATAGRYLLQTLCNAPRLAREGSLGALVDLLPGTPAIIAAAGPSLNQNVYDFCDVRGRAVLIACDTAARPLVSIGLDPDFIVATDASRTNAAHLSSLPQSASWLVAEGSLHPSAFALFEGRTFAFKVANHQPWPWLEGAGLVRPTLPTWGSVATSAFSLALAMKCDPIIFVGADFAFTDGRPYCRGTSFESLWSMWIAGGATYEQTWKTLVGHWPQVAALDVHGAETSTARHLISFRDWIVERAAEHPDVHVVNATGAGILAGPGIQQGRAAATLASAPVFDRAELASRLARLHAATRGDLGRTLRATASVLTNSDEPARDAWIEFTDRSVSPEMINAALQSPEYASWTIGVQDALQSSRNRS